MPFARLKPPIRLEILARVAVAYARGRRQATVVQQPLQVLPAKAQPRRMLPQEELANIDALRRLIGPAFGAAMRRSGSKDDGKA